MFNLILVTLSIALVAALAIAGIWYGGGAMTSGATQSAAVTIINQGQQIALATENYGRANNFNLPANVEALVTNRYLGSTPQVPTEFSTLGWQIATGTTMYATLASSGSSTAIEICSRINARASGDNASTEDAGHPNASLPFYCGLSGRSLIFYYKI